MQTPKIYNWATDSPEILRAYYHSHIPPMPKNPPWQQHDLSPSGCFQGGMVFEPKQRPLTTGMIVYFHGGSFMVGSPETHAALTGTLAQLTDMRVLSARYRLAPEHPYPAQVEDAFAAIAKAQELAPHVPIILAGDSAGAALCCWAYHACTAADIKGVALFYGGFGLTQGASIGQFGSIENGLDAEAIKVAYNRLGNHTENLKNPGYNWLHPEHHVANRLYILAAECDPLVQDSIAMAQAAQSKGAHVTYRLAKGCEHGFLKWVDTPEAITELKHAAHWLQTL